MITTGSFDFIHVGHLDLLEKARQEGSYIIVGVHSDADANSYMRKNFPIMNLHERALGVIACKVGTYLGTYLPDSNIHTHSLL